MRKGTQAKARFIWNEGLFARLRHMARLGFRPEYIAQTLGCHDVQCVYHGMRRIGVNTGGRRARRKNMNVGENRKAGDSPASDSVPI